MTLTPLFHHVIRATSILLVLAVFSSVANAEVKSLTSSELTETYIQDSTIIVTPKQKKNTIKKTVSNIKVLPYSDEQQDLDKIDHVAAHEDASKFIELDDNLLRDESISTGQYPARNVAVFQRDEDGNQELLAFADKELALQQVIDSIPTPAEQATIPASEQFNDDRFEVPEGDFEFVAFRGADQQTDLGVAVEDGVLTLTFGDLPDVDPILIDPALTDQSLSNEFVNIVLPEGGGAPIIQFTIPEELRR